jgi:hypothetical protein
MFKMCATLATATLLLTACGSQSEEAIPQQMETPAPVVTPTSVAEPNPEPCYTAPTLARAIRLTQDDGFMKLYTASARAETKLVRGEFCFIMSSGYVDLGFDSEFAMSFRDTRFGKAIRKEAQAIGTSDLALAAAFYDAAP